MNRFMKWEDIKVETRSHPRDLICRKPESSQFAHLLLSFFEVYFLRTTADSLSVNYTYIVIATKMPYGFPRFTSLSVDGQYDQYLSAWSFNNSRSNSTSSISTKEISKKDGTKTNPISRIRNSITKRLQRKEMQI